MEQQRDTIESGLPFDGVEFVDTVLKKKFDGDLVNVAMTDAIPVLSDTLRLWAINDIKTCKEEGRVIRKVSTDIAYKRSKRGTIVVDLYEQWLNSLLPSQSNTAHHTLIHRTRGRVLQVLDTTYDDFTKILSTLRAGSQNYKMRRLSPNGAEQQKKYVKQRFLKTVLDIYTESKQAWSSKLQQEYRDTTIAVESMLGDEVMLDLVASKMGVLLTELEELYDVDSYFSHDVSAYPILQLIRLTLHRAKSDDIQYARVLWYVIGQLLHEVSVNYSTEREFMRRILQEGALKDSRVIAEYIGSKAAKSYQENVLIGSCAFQGDEKESYVADQLTVLMEDGEWRNKEEHSIFYHLRNLFTHLPLEIHENESLQDIELIVSRNIESAWNIFGAVVRLAIEHRTTAGLQSNMLVKYMELLRILNKMFDAKDSLSHEDIQVEFEVVLASKILVINGEHSGHEVDEQKTNVNFNIGLANKKHEGKLNILSEGEVSSTQKFMEMLLTSAIIEYFKDKKITSLPSAVPQ